MKLLVTGGAGYVRKLSRKGLLGGKGWRRRWLTVGEGQLKVSVGGRLLAGTLLDDGRISCDVPAGLLADVGEAAGLKWRRPSLGTALREPPRHLRRLRARLSNPELPPSGSDAKEASRKAAREGPQNEV